MRIFFRNRKQKEDDKKAILKAEQQENMNINKKLAQLEKKIDLFRRLNGAEQQQQFHSRLYEIEKKLSNFLSANAATSQNTKRAIKQDFLRANEVEEKITSLYEKIALLEEKVLSLEDGNQIEQSSSPTFIIDHLHVESIVIDKLDYANNFGQLGIKELSGKLNIGTSYEGLQTPKNLSKKLNKLKEKETQAKVNIQGKNNKKT